MPKKTPLTTTEKAQLQYSRRNDLVNYSENRENAYSSKFIEVELQIASIVVGVLGAYTLFSKNTPIDFGVLIALAIGSALLILSLVFGLIAIHLLQKFWLGRMKTNHQIFDIWRRYLLSDSGDYDQAVSDCDVISGGVNILHSPKWPHYFQTIFLSLGILILITEIFILVIKNWS